MAAVDEFTVMERVSIDTDVLKKGTSCTTREHGLNTAIDAISFSDTVTSESDTTHSSLSHTSGNV
jgi:hypothetical protein